jgi:hypothetical protein
MQLGDCRSDDVWCRKQGTGFSFDRAGEQLGALRRGSEGGYRIWGPSLVVEADRTESSERKNGVADDVSLVDMTC